MKNNAKAIIEYTSQQLASIMFHYRHKTAPEHFTRESILGFKNTTLIILNLIKKSLKVEAMNFFYQYNKELATFFSPGPLVCFIEGFKR